MSPIERHQHQWLELPRRSLLLFETFSVPIPREIWHLLATICLHVNYNAYIACKFNYHIKTEGLVRVTGSDIYCETGNISLGNGTRHMLLQTTNRKWCTVIKLAFLMTLSDLQGHMPIASHLNTCSCFLISYRSLLPSFRVQVKIHKIQKTDNWAEFA